MHIMSRASASLLLILIALAAGQAVLMYRWSVASAAGGGDYSSVGIGTREPIPGGLPWYFLVVFGDNRPSSSGEVQYNPVFYRLVDELELVRPQATIGTGDHVWNGYVDQIQHFIETTRNIPNLWVVAGNHEWNNKPYVDDSNREGVNYWRTHVAPDLYYKDEVEGWRIVFINLRAGYPVTQNWPGVEQWLRTKAFNTDKKLIVVFHEDIHPKRRASKAISQVLDRLEPLLNQYKPKIVFQGHIHCYHEGSYNGITYVITGGGGAPRCNDVPHHYVVLILTNRGYTFYPVDAENTYIRITRSIQGSSTIYRIYNPKKQARTGSPVYMPVRIKISLGDDTYNLLYNAPPGTTVINVTVTVNGTLIIDTPSRANKGLITYLYDYDGDVWLADNKGDIVVKTQTTPQPPEQPQPPSNGGGSEENQTQGGGGEEANETTPPPETQEPPETHGNETNTATNQTRTSQGGEQAAEQAAASRERNQTSTATRKNGGGGIVIDEKTIGVIAIIVIGVALYPIVMKKRF